MGSNHRLLRSAEQGQGRLHFLFISKFRRFRFKRWMIPLVLVLYLLILQPHLCTKSVASKLGFIGSKSIPDYDVDLWEPFAGRISIPIDHFNASDDKTYENRYWMNDRFYKEGGPVFFFDVGEAGVREGAIGLLKPNGTLFAPLELARKYHGILIVWEHRFFGESMPFEYNKTSGFASAGYNAYKYLNNEQALEDAVYFATYFKPPGHGDHDLTSKSTPWIWIGGSYPGDRAAIIRQRNPDVFFASWSSSAPVQSSVNGSVYYNIIQQAMPSNCSADVHAAVTYADEIIANGSYEEIRLLKRIAFITNKENPKGAREEFSFSPGYLTLNAIVSILGYPFLSAWPPFQSVGYEASLGKFCNELESWNPAGFANFTMESPRSVLFNNSLDATPSKDGIAARHGSKNAFYAYIHATIRKSRYDYAAFPGKPFSSLDIISWAWMLCNQVAQFPTSPYPSPTSIISRFITINSTLETFCHSRFGYAPKTPKVEEMLKYGGWTMRPSNVMFTNGQMDPWRSMGVHADRKINPDALDRKSTQVISKCNEPPPGNEVFGLVHKGAVHAQDLRRSVRDVIGPLDAALELFGKALDAWLPCFSAAGL